MLTPFPSRPPFVACAVAALLAALAAPAAACTVCDSAGGQQVRAALLESDFTLNLMAATLPSLVFVSAVAVIHFGWPGRRAAGRDPQEDRR
jgi:hypothetical protein